MQSIRIVLKVVSGLFFFVTTLLQAQSIELKKLEFYENKVVLLYDLLDSIEGRSYSVKVYSSADGFLNPLEKIVGDVGLEVKSGKNKTITWSFTEELPATFSGRVALEIRGRLFIPFIQVDDINQYKVFKRKRKYNLTWGGGTPQNVLNFDLYRRDKKIASFPNIANVGHHSFEFPVHIRPGKDYQFIISDTKNKDEMVISNSFRIKRKVPLVVKIIPGLIVGSALYYLVTHTKEDDEVSKFPEDRLPQ